MIHKASKLIAEVFDKKGIKYGGTISECDDSSIVEAGFSIDNGPFVLVRFISTDEDNDVAVRIFRVANVQDENKPVVLKVLNELNSEFRYICFSCDDDNDINMEYDFPLRMSDDCVGATAVEMFIRFKRIADEMYPKLMKALLN